MGWGNMGAHSSFSTRGPVAGESSPDCWNKTVIVYFPLYFTIRCILPQPCRAAFSWQVTKMSLDTHTYAHTKAHCAVVAAWAGTQAADSPACVSSWVCAVFCVCGVLLPCRGLCPIITPLPLSSSSSFSSFPLHTHPHTHTHTPLPPPGLGQQPRLQHWDTPFTQSGGVRRGRRFKYPPPSPPDRRPEMRSVSPG